MFRKLFAIAVSILINCVVLAWLHAWSGPAVAATPPHASGAVPVTVLPTITVRPTQAQMRLLRRKAPTDRANSPAARDDVLPTGDGGLQTLVTPIHTSDGETG